LDFGIAKVSGCSLTATGQMVGTPHYMAPEQIMASKDLGPAVDIYAMGILLYEVLAGDPPFLADHQMDLFRMHLKETPKALAKLFPGEFLEPFDGVIQKAMSKKAAERYQSADELRVAMESALVTSVAQEQERLETTQARKRLTPSWWYRPELAEELELKSTTEAKPKEVLIEEDSTGHFPVAQARTIGMEKVEETVKMERLVLPEKEWFLTELATELEIPPLTRVYQRAGFWKRLSKLWPFSKK
jgi:serine/threonine protein kinase